MKSLTEAIKQEMGIDWDALDGKTVRIVSSGDLPFETTYTLSYQGRSIKDAFSSWVSIKGSNPLYDVLYSAWYGTIDDIEIIMDEGVPLLDNTDSETIDPESIQAGSVVLLKSKRGARRLAYKNLYRFVFFAKEDGELFYPVDGSLHEGDFCSPSCPYKIVSYITPVELIQTLTTEPSNKGSEVTNTTVHIVSPDSFEAMGKSLNELIAHSFGGDNGENLTAKPSGETTKVINNTVQPSLNLNPDVIGKKLNDAIFETFSKVDWGKK